MWEEIIASIQKEDDAKRKNWWRKLFKRKPKNPLGEPIRFDRWL